MKKLTSILLITCLCSTWLGYHLVFDVQLSALKSEMKASLRDRTDQKDVVQLSFSPKEARQLEWEEEMEFNYNGEMFDVVEKKVQGDRLILRCIPDTKETALLLEYQKHTRRNSSNSFIAQLITAPYILPLDNLMNQLVCKSNNRLPELSPGLPTTNSTVPSPPPDGC
ncbi:MAG: hypothetical protein ACXVBK_16935 [Flavisolibacter sp.]